MDWPLKLVCWLLLLAMLLESSLASAETGWRSAARAKDKPRCDKRHINANTGKCINDKLDDGCVDTPKSRVRNCNSQRTSRAPEKTTTEMSSRRRQTTTSTTTAEPIRGTKGRGGKENRKKPRSIRLEGSNVVWSQAHSAQHKNMSETFQRTRRMTVDTTSPDARENDAGLLTAQPPPPASRSGDDFPSDIPPEGTRSCGCYVKGPVAACTSQLQHKRVPACVDSSVTTLFIKSEQVDELSAEAFRNLQQLKNVSITDTKLTSLPRDLFYDTKNMKHVVVQQNPNLTSLHSDVFRGAYKLEDVILDHNSIISLDRDVFTNLTNVKRLNLGYNKISSLPEGVFRGNRQLEELLLSGNPLQMSPGTARFLLRNNAKLRVLLMSSCELDALPTGLLDTASHLEWLDLSRNRLSRFPAQFIRDCTQLGLLQLSHNRLTVLSPDVLHQHGGHLATLSLEGNPWQCSCDLLPLAAWTALRHDSVPVVPRCSSPPSVRKQALRRWLHSKHAAKCAGATLVLRADLDAVLSASRSIAEDSPGFTHFLNGSAKRSARLPQITSPTPWQPGPTPTSAA